MTQPDDDRPAVTGRLNSEQRHALVIPGLGGFGSRFTTRDVEYHNVPFNYQTMANSTPWRVQLRFGSPAPRIVIGLDIHGDTTLGRGSQGPGSPDIDLTNLNALDLGISRRHALFRPTETKLFLIDLESTNGTFVNAIPVGRGMAQVLRSGDTIALAGLNFMIEVVHSPRTIGEAQAAEAEKEKEESGDTKRESLQVGKDAGKQPDDPLPSFNPVLTGEDTMMVQIDPEELKRAAKKQREEKEKGKKKKKK